ncbi:hypothetical protein COLO4_15641 [Corchorus olitorius]|uniref:Uncharacterized protein n=1 Tax=Corchorus olitorius TaxID=93759 RepID=A0A1R3JM05_9ROSI|nr:hypothetical protein COLO4_15641 [Corchorus olitorius]
MPKQKPTTGKPQEAVNMERDSRRNSVSIKESVGGRKSQIDENIDRRKLTGKDKVKVTSSQPKFFGEGAFKGEGFTFKASAIKHGLDVASTSNKNGNNGPKSVTALNKAGAKRFGSANNRPFRFEAAWLSNVEFKPMFSVAWGKGHGYLLKSIEEVTKEVQVWKTEVFGSIHKNKRILMARIRGISSSFITGGGSLVAKIMFKLDAYGGTKYKILSSEYYGEEAPKSCNKLDD